MLQNYFKVAWRHLQASKLYAIVNIFGLAIGIASCLLIGMYIWDELSFDQFHTNKDRIVRITWEYNFDDADTRTALTGTRVGPEFTRRFPEVEAFVRTMKYGNVVSNQEKMYDEKNFLYADSTFFSLFSFPLLQGNARTVLDAPNKMVLTASAAKKYFGQESAMGKTLKVGGTKDFVITGIAADVPQYSQIKFDMVGSFSSLGASKTEKWSEANYVTYLLLRKNEPVSSLQSKIDAYCKEIGKDELKLQGNQHTAYHLEPLSRVHLHSDLEGLEPNNSISYIYIMAIVAFMILLIAGVNYTNLSIAQSAGRNTEVGMRKVMGARKGQLFRQFIVESFLLSLIALLLALLISWLLLPYYNQLSGKHLHIEVMFQPSGVAALLALAILIALCAGTYPALVLSRNRIMNILKSGFIFSSSGSLRKTLIVFQFVISIFLTGATIVLLQQLSYIRNKDLGYDKQQVVVLPVDRIVSKNYDNIKRAIALTPGVLSVGGAYEEPTDIGWGDGITTTDGKSITVNALPVDEDAIRTLGMHIIAGSDFTQADVQQFDTSNDGKNIRYTFMLNQSAVNALGWTPEQALGRTIQKGNEGTIKAVVKDFHFHSFHEPIKPLVIFLDKRLVGSMFVKISGKDIPGTIGRLSTTWKQRINHRPFEYKFLDDDYEALYQTEQRTANVFTTFSTLAIILSCLGLFALTAYTMVRRTKEIGIRKILGASLSDILLLVSKDFLKLVMLALAISIPLAFYAINKWLQTFSYRISVEWWVFAVSGLLTLVIAFVTVSLQAARTAFANPVKNLRTE
ncbi:MAG: ABC transporter permease [Flavisolibacter sp.]